MSAILLHHSLNVWVPIPHDGDAFAGGTGNVAWTFGYNPASQVATDTGSNRAIRLR